MISQPTYPHELNGLWDTVKKVATYTVAPVYAANKEVLDIAAEYQAKQAAAKTAEEAAMFKAQAEQAAAAAKARGKMIQMAVFGAGALILFVALTKK